MIVVVADPHAISQQLRELQERKRQAVNGKAHLIALSWAGALAGLPLLIVASTLNLSVRTVTEDRVVMMNYRLVPVCPL
jgi:hypothetical protein